MRAKTTGTAAPPRVAAHACEAGTLAWPAVPGGDVVAELGVSLEATRQRLARLTRTIEADVIPRLVAHHREHSGNHAGEGAGLAATASDIPTAGDVAALVTALLDADDGRIAILIQQLRQRGVTVERIYMELLTPAARRLGVLWEEDGVDFSAVTVALGRLQRLLRLLSPTFGSEVDHPALGRRLLLTQPEQELHMFGLVMVAEFFRRDGWDVLGGVAGVGIDAVKWARRDWFDVVGFSIGHENGLPWLRDNIAAVRASSRNRQLVVLVGGPVFSLHPAWADEVGADATADASSAPATAEALLLRSAQDN